jgi:hypothetical protein
MTPEIVADKGVASAKQWRGHNRRIRLTHFHDGLWMMELARLAPKDAKPQPDCPPFVVTRRRIRYHVIAFDAESLARILYMADMIRLEESGLLQEPRRRGKVT